VIVFQFVDFAGTSRGSLLLAVRDVLVHSVALVKFLVCGWRSAAKRGRGALCDV